MRDHEHLKKDKEQSRRGFLARAAAAAGGVLFLSPGLVLAEDSKEKGKDVKKPAEKEEQEVTPVEDLMREHGALNRILLIYDEAIARLGRSGADMPPEVLSGAAGIVRSFIEDYHEKLEENFLFPRFRKAGKQVDLVEVLLAQHLAGRNLTDKIRHLATPPLLKEQETRRELSEVLRQFSRMYRPHEAREDTVLFPALKSIVSPHEYAALGEDFEKKEHELFGEDGFEKMVDEIAGLERKLGIYDLSQFTPRT